MNKAALISLSALVVVACAAPTTTDEPVTYGDGDGDGSGTGGAGSGGVVTGTSGGAPAAGSGGAAVVPGAGGAGVVPGAGGAGVVPGAGGAAAIGANCSATGFVVNNGYADNGSMCGFAWTSTWDGATIDPPCGTGACFEASGAELCGSGTIPAEADPMYPGLMIGWNAQQNAEGGTNGTWTASGTGLTANFTATGATGATRVVIQSGASDYCAAATSGTPIPWASFTVGCWDTGGAAFSAGMPITAVAVQVNSAAAAQTVDLCVTSITVN